jgi:hypothetical protein
MDLELLFWNHHQNTLPRPIVWQFLLCYHNTEFAVKWGIVMKQKRGRPRRYAPGKRPTLTFRVQEPMHKDLAKTAKDQQRSISEEIEHRLNEWAAWKKAREEFERLRAEAKAERDAAKAQHNADRIAAIRAAGFQIVRDAGGNVTVNVSPELLLGEADGILRSGFVAAENIGKSTMEIMIERAVENALSKAGIGRKKDVA